MKYLLLVLFICFVSVSCINNKGKEMAKTSIDSTSFTTIKWMDSIVNFGSIVKGEKITIKFRCINTGDKPLIITSAVPGCGCTVADYTKEPILPGKEGAITASFNSANFSGEVHKYITVNTNTKNAPETRLSFTGLITEEIGSNKTVEKQLTPKK